ncbi:hypothetical protein FUAX_16800 [Fulvitalea axinellae]|uniref:Uncharacterized protein n=1 Tax=Fulvitalea axinellae TaxID=1182444 RepID=A0AAU9CZW1_9BACT|nr:hypothetical protein FUAX_16800 [Fulvitalea axinellae]
MFAKFEGYRIRRATIKQLPNTILNLTTIQRMRAFQSVENLLRELGGKRERLLIDYVFKHREATFDTLVHLAEGDIRLVNSLVAKSVFAKTGETVFLDERLRTFFDRFLGINEEIQNYEIDERIGAMRRNIRMFMLEDNWAEKERILEKLKNSLNGLGRVVKRNVIELSKRVQHDYKTEENLKVKRLKIEEHDEKARKLRQLIASIEDVLDNKTFLQEANDPMLRKMVTDLRYEYLRDAKTNLRELHHEIVSYLNRFEFLQEYFKKLQTIRRHKKLFELEKRTNVEELIKDNNTLIFEPRILMPANPSLEFMASDDGQDMVRKVSEKVEHRWRKRLRKSESIGGDMLDTDPVTESRINYAKIRDLFFESGTDLFSFIVNYEFEQEVDLEQRVAAFCKVALLYEDEMDFTGHVEVYEKVRHAVILPLKKKRKTKKPAMAEAH